MKFLLTCFFAIVFQQVSAQADSLTNKLELSLVSGYHQPLGIFGFKIGYRPPVFRRLLQFNAGLGGGRVQSVRLTIGLNFYPVQEWLVTPYVGVDYGLAVGTTLGSEDGSELYDVGFHHYLVPYGGFKIKSWNRMLHFKLKFGYSNLLNQPQIKVLGIQGPGYGEILRRVQSHWMLAVGVGIRLN